MVFLVFALEAGVLDRQQAAATGSLGRAIIACVTRELRLGLDLGQGWAQAGPGLCWARAVLCCAGPGLGQELGQGWVGLGQGWARARAGAGAGLGRGWAQAGPGLGWARAVLC